MALIGVGANLPGPDGRSALDTCRHAVASLAFPGCRLAGLSRWYASAPVPASDQPLYINGVALLVSERKQGIDPISLLEYLMGVEAACGRRRGVPNAARTLDLDIIGMGSLVRAAPDPIVPHPRAHLRAFVLAPLAEVAPDWVHPVLGRTATALLVDLPLQDIRPL